MPKPLKALLIEDSEDDALLMAHALQRGGYELKYERVDTPQATDAALQKQAWDVIICDHSMPRFDIPSALEMVRSASPDMPFIIVSGTIGEDAAVAAMKAGANDYVMKGKLARLAPAVEREIREAEVRRQRRNAELERAKLLIAERKAREEAEKARREAEEASRIKDEFLATLSHELRTPLTAILGWVRLLNGGKLTREGEEHAVRVIERNARAQAHLINDLLDISRIISGKLRLRIETVDLAAVIKAAIDTVSLAAQAKNIEFEVKLDELPPISGDSSRLQQVVWNLLANAVKYTPKGGRVSIRLEQQEGLALIIISDTGAGISRDFLPHVFERFRQEDMSTTRAYSGLGVGLAIVRYLVELHGGTVSAASEGEGHGAVFAVSLPMSGAQSETAAAAPAQMTASESDATADVPLDGISVLVVEDDVDTRELLVHILNQHHAQTVAVDSVSAAIEELDRKKPDVMVADLGMPGEDGFSLIRKVRARADAVQSMPAIAVTAYVRPEDRTRVMSAGYQAHVPKPIDPEILVQTVADAVRSHGNGLLTGYLPNQTIRPQSNGAARRDSAAGKA